MQVLYSKTHLDEKFPDVALTKVFSHLFLKVLSQVLILAQLHHDVKLVTRLERIIKSDDVLILQLIHQESLTKCLIPLLAAHPTKINLLEHVNLPVFLFDDFVDHSEGALS